MRIIVDIPDPMYRELKAKAARGGHSVRELILEGVAVTLLQGAQVAKPRARGKWPVLRSKNPGSLKLGPEGIYEYISFP